jgi:hypothetical protein
MPRSIAAETNSGDERKQRQQAGTEQKGRNMSAWKRFGRLAWLFSRMDVHGGAARLVGMPPERWRQRKREGGSDSQADRHPIIAGKNRSPQNRAPLMDVSEAYQWACCIHTESDGCGNLVDRCRRPPTCPSSPPTSARMHGFTSRTSRLSQPSGSWATRKMRRPAPSVPPPP